MSFRGGPAEIIEHGISGFQIDPYHGEEAANTIVDFFERCADDTAHWDEISQGVLNHVCSHKCDGDQLLQEGTRICKLLIQQSWRVGRNMISCEVG